MPAFQTGFFVGRRTRITAAYDSSAGNRGNAHPLYPRHQWELLRKQLEYHCNWMLPKGGKGGKLWANGLQIDESYWQLIDSLHRAIPRLSEVDAYKAKGIISWYRENDSLTRKQEDHSRVLIEKAKSNKKKG